MSDLSRLLDDVYQNGPAAPAPKRTAPEPAAPEPAASAPAAPAPEPEAELAWDSSARLDEAFSDWVPGPTADSPQAERDLFDFGDEEPAASVLEHVFADDTSGPIAPAAPGPAHDEPADDPMADLSDLFADEPVAPTVQAPIVQAPVAPAPAPAPAPVAEAPAPAPVSEAPAVQPQPVQPQVAEHRVAPVVEAPAPAPRPTTPARPLAYEPPMSLAEALGEAPDAPTGDLLRPAEAPAEPDASWPLAGFAPAPVEAAPADADDGVADTGLATSWRREHDDLLPARSGRRRR